MKSISYGYTNTTWKDLLKTYDGATIIYDNSGNPTSYRGDSMQWSNNQLTQQTHNGSTITYTCNESGLRTKKNVSGGTQTTYVWKDGVLCAMQSGTKVLEFSYSANGDVVSVLMRNQGASSGTRYYYARNAQGDVIGLVNSSGTMVIRYTYDSWGKLISTTGTATIGTLNPFRYRGYIYDTETGLYYLKTRYYDPEVGRFINADATDVLLLPYHHSTQYNLFAYCNNNPVNDIDDDGELSLLAKIAIGVGAVIVGAAVVAATAATGGAAAAFIGAAVAGVKAAALSGAIGAAVGAGAGAVSHRVSTGSWKGAGKATLVGAVNGFADGFMTGGITAGAGMAAGALGKASSGIQIGKTAKPQYGRANVGYGTPRTNGSTLISIQNNAGKRIFSLDFDASNAVHMHLPKLLSKTHIPIGAIGSGIYAGVRQW